MASLGDRAPCLKGCGRETLNRHGICKECRKYECRICGAKDSWKEIEKTLCTRCEKKLKNDDVKYINSWG